MSEDEGEITFGEAIQKAKPDAFEGVLVGYVLVAEWVGPSGQRTLTRNNGTMQGDVYLPEWQQKGYLHEALFGNWNS